MKSASERLVLGLDLGTNSLGWSLIKYDSKSPKEIVHAGVNIFPEGVKHANTNKEESLNVKRRKARQARRQTYRKSQRIRKLARVLMETGLLPVHDYADGPSRHQFLCELDRDLCQRLNGGFDKSFPQFPYFLRKIALDHPLPIHAFGRALFHLGHRRGFLSNRKKMKKMDEKEAKKVEEGIRELAAAMVEKKARTLGEYLANVDPVHERRLRNRWTARSMYVHEFKTLWNSQAKHHPDVLNEKTRSRIFSAIFDQRELKSQKGLIGPCELETGKKRAPKALELFQRFRYWQKLNDTIINFHDGDFRPLTLEEKQKVAERLETNNSLSYDAIRGLLDLPPNSEFNFETGGKERMEGNTTAYRLRKFFGEWDLFEEEKRQRIVGEILGIEDPETLLRRGSKAWSLSEETLTLLQEQQGIELEPGYGSLSKQAMKKTLPLLMQGISFATARNMVYGSMLSKEACDFLPPLTSTGIRINNPTVTHCLSELRKVVNEIIRVYGKPDEIRIELARDLKKPLKERMSIQKTNYLREKKRKELREKIQACGVLTPKRHDIEKALLYEECGGVCPYTGKKIDFSSMYVENSPWDVEHIIPFSRCLDDSFGNKTLCYHEENRCRKRNMTPFEAYTKKELEEILERVRKFKMEEKPKKENKPKTKKGKKEKPRQHPKLKRFGLRGKNLLELDEFVSQKLNDTRYASKLALRFVSHLYGEEANKRVQVSNGQVTAHFRSAWGLNSILSDTGLKLRDDHRHHVVDAIVIGLTDRGMVKQLSDAAVRQWEQKQRTWGWWKHVNPPWDGFREEVTERINQTLVSFQPSRKLSGVLHKDTIYGVSRGSQDSADLIILQRKPLDGNFNRKNLYEIHSDRTRELVGNWLEKYEGDPKEAFGVPANHPQLGSSGIPIHRVRIRSGKSNSLFRVGDERQPRHVASDSNHHMVIFEERNKKGGVKWGAEMVSRFEAAQRFRSKKPVIQREFEEGKRFICSIAPRDVFSLVNDDGVENYFVVRCVSDGNIEYVSIYEARKQVEIKKSKRWAKGSVNVLRKKGFRKIRITSLGEIITSND